MANQILNIYTPIFVCLSSDTRQFTEESIADDDSTAAVAVVVTLSIPSTDLEAEIGIVQSSVSLFPANITSLITSNRSMVVLIGTPYVASIAQTLQKTYSINSVDDFFSDPLRLTIQVPGYNLSSSTVLLLWLLYLNLCS